MAITIRAATTADARRLFDWRNDVLTRSMSVNTDPIKWSSHLAWLERRLSQRSSNLYVTEENGTPVGAVRIDDDKINYTVAPDHRGKGIATAMLVEAFRLFGKKRAEIKAENVASIRAAEKAGFEVVII